MTREKLPDRRPGLGIQFSHAFPGQSPDRWHMTIGLRADGQLGEIFIDHDRQSSALALLVHEVAVVTSMCLQRGATIDEIRSALMRDDAPTGSPEGKLGVPHTPLGSALDLIDQILRSADVVA